MHEKATIDLGEHYVKQTQRNRCSIHTANGTQDLSIPVIRPHGSKTSTGTVLVSDEMGWRRDHWRSITAAYAYAPYFEHYADDIQNLIFQKTKPLHIFNQNCMDYVAKQLDLTFTLSVSTSFLENPVSDYRTFEFDSTPIPYQQVLFNDPQFVANLSILDALFCLGPMARKLIL